MVSGDGAASQALRDLLEDRDDFKSAHIAETRGSRTAFVEARRLPLPGSRLLELAKRGLIESNGYTAYRPKR